MSFTTELLPPNRYETMLQHDAESLRSIAKPNSSAASAWRKRKRSILPPGSIGSISEMPEVKLFFPRLGDDGVVLDWYCANEDRVYRLLWEICTEELGQGDRMPVPVNEECIICDGTIVNVGLCDSHFAKFEQYISSSPS